MQIPEEFETDDTHRGHGVLDITSKGGAVINVLTSFGSFNLNVTNTDGTPATRTQSVALFDELKKGLKA